MLWRLLLVIAGLLIALIHFSCFQNAAYPSIRITFNHCVGPLNVAGSKGKIIFPF